MSELVVMSSKRSKIISKDKNSSMSDYTNYMIASTFKIEPDFVLPPPFKC